jgi:hypothetical protein
MLLETVFCTLFPGRTWVSSNSHDQRDAMHAAWTIRYASDGLITEEKRLLRRRHAMREKYNGFSILTPDDALVTARRIQGRAEIRARPGTPSA